MLVVAISTMSGSAFAQATRTWISGVGDDVNPCSRTAPCKTFAGAISKTAPGGQISVLDPGGFGAVTITKAITLEGYGVLGSIINSSVNGILVNAGVNDNVILRNLQIDGGGSGLAGVNILSANNVVIDHVAIFNQGDATQGRGIQSNPSSGVTVNLYLHDLDIYRCAVNGIRAGGLGVTNLYADDVRVANIGTTTAHDGILLEANTSTEMRNVRVFHSAGSGLKLNAVAVGATVEDSLFSRNGGDGIQINAAGAAARLSNSNMTLNTGAGVRVNAGVVSSYLNNRSSGNGAADSAPSTSTGY
jgi:hypothetical protein